jgi:acid phosphatase family membrane protein YuiD
MEFFEELWENPYLRNMIWCVAVTKVIWLMLDPDMAPGARRFAPSAPSAAIASMITMGAIWDGGYADPPVVFLLPVAFVIGSDAIHRRELSRQAARFNQLVQELKKHNIECDLPPEPLPEDAGSSLIQIVLGIVVGVIATLVGLFFLY